jgi:hypothetical protein
MGRRNEGVRAGGDVGRGGGMGTAGGSDGSMGVVRLRRVGALAGRGVTVLDLNRMG